MRIKCQHGYFIFEEQGPGEISQFSSHFGLTLVPKNNYFTFPFLQNAPSFSIKGLSYLGVLATSTFEGDPWEVMRQNELVYDFRKGLVVPISTVTQMIKISRAGNYFLSSGLILPGSLTDEGQRVTDYSAWYSFKSASFKYSEVTYE